MFSNISFASELTFKTSEIDYLNSGNIINAKDGIAISTEDNIKIKAKQFQYNKNLSTIKAQGNVEVNDSLRKVLIKSENIMFNTETKMIESKTTSSIEDTLGNLQNMLDSDDGPIDVSGVDQLPNSEQVHDHISGLLDGKLGKLAKEIAEETAAELNFDAEGATSVNDVFQSLFKNPGKLMNLVKNVGGKLDDKIKSGEIKESEIMEEASGLLGKMKDVPGMGDIQSMMKKMGMGGGPGGMGGLDALSALSSMGGGMGGLDALSALGGLGGLAGLGGGKNNKLDLGAMQNAMEQNMKSLEKREKMKQRINEKADKRRIELQVENERLQNIPQTLP